MDNLLIDNNQINQPEFLAYFACEIIYFIGIFINLLLYGVLKQKDNTKRISDFITFGVFVVSSVIFGAFYLRNLFAFDSFNLTIFNDSIVLNDKVILLKLFINIFMALFISTTYKITRKTKYKAPLINTIVLSVGLLSGILVQFNDAFGTYLLLEGIVFLIYKYASQMRFQRDEPFCFDFILMSAIASVLFFVFYFMTFFIKDSVRLSIFQVCMSCAILLKAGLFPIYNYAMNRHFKSNIAYSILLFCFLPMLGIIVYNKFAQTINLVDEIYQFSMFAFAAAIMLTSALRAFKTKNLIKFLADASYCYSAFCIIGILFSSLQDLSIKLSMLICLCIFGLYSMTYILKINLQFEKINIASLKGMFIYNKMFTGIFAILLLILVNVFPSGIFACNLSIIHNIYIFDKIGVFPILSAMLANALILVFVLKMIKNCYSFKKIETAKKLIKRTTPNYVVPILIILFLIINLFTDFQ